MGRRDRWSQQLGQWLCVACDVCVCVHVGGVVSVRIEREDVKGIYIMEPRQKTVASFPGSPGSGRGEPGNEAKNTVQYSGILLTHTGAVVCFV